MSLITAGYNYFLNINWCFSQEEKIITDDIFSYTIYNSLFPALSYVLISDFMLQIWKHLKLFVSLRLEGYKFC